MREALTDKIATRLIALSRPRKAVVIATFDALLAMACLALVLQLAPALSRGGFEMDAWLLVLTGSGLAAVVSLGSGLARLPLKDFAMLGAGKAVVPPASLQWPSGPVLDGRVATLRSSLAARFYRASWSSAGCFWL